MKAQVTRNTTNIKPGEGGEGKTSEDKPQMTFETTTSKLM